MPSSKLSLISEDLCIGCGICVKVCPFNAIQIINLPRELDKETTHRYGPNSFKLHRLPVPKPGQVLGLVGTNGIGKSTALKILAGTLKPNLGKFTVSKIEHLFVIPVEVTLSYETYRILQIGMTF
jgi:ATP-binding cassette subfamily E protein 1